VTRNYTNRILRRLPPHELARFAEVLELVPLTLGQPVYEQGKPVAHAYFPESGVISVVTELLGGEVIETATIGREGMVGLAAFLGMSNASGRAFCQVPGHAHRVRADALIAEADRGGALARVLLRFTNAFMAMLAQSAACNRAHSLEERMCRWLLMMRDRVDTDTFPLTQTFLGQMLGVRRPTVSLAGASLQKAGLIQYRRGKMTILDRVELEAASCECYAFVRQQFEDAYSEGSS
jgi:CRP-like cAMP-binding protein